MTAQQEPNWTQLNWEQ